MLPFFEIIIKPEAESDFIKIWEWYEEVSYGLGIKFLDNFIVALEKIERNAQHCFNVGHGYRRANIKEFPYNIYFQIDGEEVNVFGIFHQHRNPKEWQKRKK